MDYIAFFVFLFILLAVVTWGVYTIRHQFPKIINKLEELEKKEIHELRENADN